ncbi:homocysteine S-methyltransferase family protein [Caldicellulosiruptoraceae bacterium PP1]
MNYDKIMIFDGAMGTQLMNKGLTADQCPDYWSIIKPDIIKEIHQSYINAGSDVIETNTFGANRVKLKKFNLDDKVEQINIAAVTLAKETASNNTLVAQSVGPTGEILKPIGDFDFDTAVDVFYEQILAGLKAGADIISLETMSDIREMKAAFLGYLYAKQKLNSNALVITSFTFEQNGKTLMGNSPEVVSYTLSFMGADIVGANCSGGPDLLLNVIEKMYQFSLKPLSVKPNAGIPKSIDGQTVYENCVPDFLRLANSFINNGVRLYGGCCGTTPEYIYELSKNLKGKEMPIAINAKPNYITSLTRIVDINNINKIEHLEIDNNYSEDIIYDLIGVEADAIEIIIKENISNDIIKEFLINSQNILKIPYIFNLKDNTHIDIIDKYYCGIYGIKNNINSKFGVKIN